MNKSISKDGGYCVSLEAVDNVSYLSPYQPLLIFNKKHLKN